MKSEYPQAWEHYWDQLAQEINEFGIKFVAGDFNMSLTEVPNQLRSRGIQCDCVAWYPWQQVTAVADRHPVIFQECNHQPLGFDSCAIFYIGGSVKVTIPWSLQHIDALTAVAGNENLDRYKDNWPGQPWKCYRRGNIKQNLGDKGLRDMLVDLLTPSTKQSDLDCMLKRVGVHYCPYLRLKQKELDLSEWLVDGTMHKGAHFPLCVWTHNAPARSEASERARQEKPGAKGKGKPEPKGKGKATDEAPGAKGAGKTAGETTRSRGEVFADEPAHAPATAVAEAGSAWAGWNCNPERGDRDCCSGWSWNEPGWHWISGGWTWNSWGWNDGSGAWGWTDRWRS